jgi:hypothetical protein
VIVSDIKIASYRGWCELQAQVKSDTAKKPFLLRYCFPPSLKESVSSENGDPFLAALLLPAMKLHETLEIPAPVSPKLLRATDEIQALYNSWDKSLSKVRINSPVRKEEPSVTLRSPRHALFFSCGVDSYYSLFKNVTNHPKDEETITDLIVVRGFDNPFQARRPSAFRTVLANARKVSGELQKNTLPVATNVRDFAIQFVRWDRLYHGAAMASVGLALESVFHRIYIASSFRDPCLVTPWGSHPGLDPLWSTERLSLSHDGFEARRVDKIRFIVQFPIVMDTLRVCTLRPFPGDVYNCGLCEKCLRTMVGLHLAGALERSRTLPRYIDLRVLRSIHITEELREFTEELLTDLGSSKTDLAIRSTLEEALSESTRSRPARAFFSRFLTVAAYAPPLLRLWVRLWRALRRSPPSSIFDLLRFSY